MSLMEILRADQLIARKNKQTNRAALLTTLIGEAAMIGKNAGNRESTDEEVISTIQKFLKNVGENVKIACAKNDLEWCDKLDEEHLILSAYLPKQLTEEEIRSILAGRDKNKGVLMKFFKENYAGRYDGRLVASIVDEYIKS